MSGDTFIADAIGNPLLGDYGLFLFLITFKPSRPGDTLADVADLFTWYSFVNTATVVDAINGLLQRRASGETVFYNIYTKAEKTVNPSLEDTELFISPVQGVSEDTKPHVVMCSTNGGFAYTGPIHDSIPYALWLSRHDYTAFTLQYHLSLRNGRIGPVRAVSFVHSHAGELGMGPACYLLQDGPAGAHLAVPPDSHGPSRFGGGDVPDPGIVVMQHTGLSEISGAEPPTYAYVGTVDGIALWHAMQARTDTIAAAGTLSEPHTYNDLPHGFGLGIGTVAEGWIEDAAALWQARIDAVGP